MVVALLEREVSLISKLPDQSDKLCIIDTCDFLISEALKFQRALLHAEARPEEKRVSWFLRDRSENSIGEDGLLYLSGPGSMPFRSMLARFAVSYLDEGSLYGGYSCGRMHQNGNAYGYTLALSNDGRSDFWIRLYTWRLTEGTVGKDGISD